MSSGTKIKVGSLFSGIGGIELGLEMTGGFSAAWFVESDPYCQRILRRHWADAPIYDDVTQLDYSSLPPVDMLSGGFPCQGFSVAASSRRKGFKHEGSSLWSAFARSIQFIRPQLILIENVPGLLVLGGSRLLSDLASLGYNAEWEVLSAGAIGASHLRRRLWIVAYSDSLGFKEIFDEGELATQKDSEERLWQPCRANRSPLSPDHIAELCGVPDGLSPRVDRIRALGNSVYPPLAQMIGYLILKKWEPLKSKDHD